MIPWWLGNTLIVFVFLLGALFMCWFVFRPDFISKNKKKLDLAILLIGATGLIGLTADNRMQIADIELKSYEGWSYGSSNPLRISLGADWSCIGSRKSSLSPPNYDERVQALKDLCAWHKSALAVFNELDFRTFPELPDIIAKDFPASTAKVYPQFHKRHEQNVVTYETFLHEVQSVQSRTGKSLFEYFLSLLSPFLIALAIAMSGARIIREPNNAN